MQGGGRGGGKRWELGGEGLLMKMFEKKKPKEKNQSYYRLVSVTAMHYLGRNLAGRHPARVSFTRINSGIRCRNFLTTTDSRGGWKQNSLQIGSDVDKDASRDLPHLHFAGHYVMFRVERPPPLFQHPLPLLTSESYYTKVASSGTLLENDWPSGDWRGPVGLLFEQIASRTLRATRKLQISSPSLTRI